jgi:exopolyphosphatase / guanosine-5'-triphosphate,3'-diphosphate pyrophosphatase
MSDQSIGASPTSVTSRQCPTTALRWEWRTFGRRFGPTENRLATLGPSEPRDSEEIYFLSHNGENVKVRDDLMDVKDLREVNLDGLEQWAPVMKAAFPLSAIDCEKVFDALRIPMNPDLREPYSLRALIEAFARPNSGVRVVNVHKRRVRYTIEGCMAELSDIRVNGEPVRTIAVESEDAEAVMRAVELLGLVGFVNTSYPRGLERLINHAPERYAVIDAGTNSIKFHIAERSRDGSWTTVSDRAELTRLGEGLAESGRIGDAAMTRTADAIEDMVAEAMRNGVRAVAAVGTAGLRIAANSADVLAFVRERTGVRIQVLSGEEEARLAYFAAVAALAPAVGEITVFDTGGGSSQFTFGHRGQVEERFSVNVGAARYTEQFGLDGAVPDNVLREALTEISSDLARLDGRSPTDVLVGMGGAVTNITAVSLGLASYDPGRVQGAVITGDEIDRQIELYRSRDADERRSIVGLQPKRAEVILAGACIVKVVLQKLGQTDLTVSDRGLRHGVLAERFGD